MVGAILAAATLAGACNREPERYRAPVPDTPAPAAATPTAAGGVADFTVLGRSIRDIGRGLIVTYTIAYGGARTTVEVPVAAGLNEACLSISIGAVLPPNCR